MSEPPPDDNPYRSLATEGDVLRPPDVGDGPGIDPPGDGERHGLNFIAIGVGTTLVLGASFVVSIGVVVVLTVRAMREGVAPAEIEAYVLGVANGLPLQLVNEGVFAFSILVGALATALIARRDERRHMLVLGAVLLAVNLLFTLGRDDTKVHIAPWVVAIDYLLILPTCLLAGGLVAPWNRRRRRA